MEDLKNFIALLNKATYDLTILSLKKPSSPVVVQQLNETLANKTSVLKILKDKINRLTAEITNKLESLNGAEATEKLMAMQQELNSTKQENVLFAQQISIVKRNHLLRGKDVDFIARDRNLHSTLESLSDEIKLVTSKRVELKEKQEKQRASVAGLKLMFNSIRATALNTLEKVCNKEHDSSLATHIRNILIELDSEVAKKTDEAILQDAPELPARKEPRREPKAVKYLQMIPIDAVKKTRTVSTFKRPQLFDREYVARIKGVGSKVRNDISQEAAIDMSFDNIDEVTFETFTESSYMAMKKKINRMQLTVERLEDNTRDTQIVDARKLKEVEEKVGNMQVELENVAAQNEFLSIEVKKLHELSELAAKELELKKKYI